MGYDRGQATEEFRRWSACYDRSILQRLLFGPAHRAMLARIEHCFRDRPTAILDVGCGTGVFAALIRRSLPKATVWGVDLVADMLAGGRARWQALGDHAAPIQADSERLPFPSGAFDVVACANSFHHYPHQERAVAEMHRVLKPGGRLILVDGYRDVPWGWFIYDLCVAGVEGDVRHVSARGARDLLDQAGFIDVHQNVHGVLAPFLLTDGAARQAAPLRMPKVQKATIAASF